jgi:membrane fusion protein (multidrug efflux system)
MNRLLYVMLTLAALIVSCGGEQTATENGPERISVRVSPATRGNMVVQRDFTGTIEGIEQARLPARLSETIAEVKVRPGDRVGVDDVLVVFDKSGSASGFEQARAYFENAQKTRRKMQNLFDEGAISEHDFDAAETAFEVARANYIAARDLTEVRSSIAGVVTEVKVNEGDQATVGQILATVSRVDSLRIRFGVDPEDIADVELGMSAEVRPVGRGDEPVYGVVNRVSESADPKTRAFDVEVLLAGNNPHLRPGGFAVCRLPLIHLTDVLKVPDDALVLQEGIKKVFLVRGDTAFTRIVETGESADGFTQVTSGVSEGDLLVTVGHSFLEDGSSVRIETGEAVDR